MNDLRLKIMEFKILKNGMEIWVITNRRQGYQWINFFDKNINCYCELIWFPGHQAIKGNGKAEECAVTELFLDETLPS